MNMRVLLGIRDVRLLLVGQGLSWVGDAFNPIALSVAVVLSGGGAAELGVILASGVVARLLCSLVGGVWADRITPHRIMVVADLARAASVGATAVAFGPVPGFTVNALTFVWSAVCVARLQARSGRAAARRSMVTEVREGLAE